MRGSVKSALLIGPDCPRQSTNSFSPALEISLLCGRVQIDFAAADRLKLLACNGVNWTDVVATAKQHRMAAVLHEAIAAVHDLDLTPAQRRMVDEAFRRSATNALGLAGELVRLCRLFEAARVSVIPYKGPVLAALAYGNFAKRDYLDLDFALPQRLIPDAIRVLESAGYRPAFDPREGHAGQDPFAPGQYSFEAQGRAIQVELHTERTLRYFPTPIDFRELDSRLMDVEISGQRVRTFSVEDTLVMLCVHGAKHFWDRLGWIFDIAKLISVQQVDWSLLLRIAARMKSRRVVLLGLCLAHDLFGAFLPPSVLRQAESDRNVRKLAQKVLDQYRGGTDPGAGVRARAVFRFQSRDGFGQGLHHLLRLVLSPTESDRQTIRLPRAFAPLYWIVRPWRLLREYGLGPKGRRSSELAVSEPTPTKSLAKIPRLANEAETLDERRDLQELPSSQNAEG